MKMCCLLQEVHRACYVKFSGATVEEFLFGKYLLFLSIVYNMCGHFENSKSFTLHQNQNGVKRIRKSERPIDGNSYNRLANLFYGQFKGQKIHKICQEFCNWSPQMGSISLQSWWNSRAWDVVKSGFKVQDPLPFVIHFILFSSDFGSVCLWTWIFHFKDTEEFP